MVRLDTQSVKTKTTTKKSIDSLIRCMLTYQSTLVGNQFNSCAAVLYFLNPVQLCVGCYCLPTLISCHEFHKSTEGFVVYCQGKPGIERVNSDDPLNSRWILDADPVLLWWSKWCWLLFLMRWCGIYVLCLVSEATLLWAFLAVSWHVYKFCWLNWITENNKFNFSLI